MITDLNSDNCLRLGRECSFSQEWHMDQPLAAVAIIWPPTSDSPYRGESSYTTPDSAAWISALLSLTSPHRSHLSNTTLPPTMPYISPLYTDLPPTAVTLLHHYQNMISPTLLGPQYGHKIAATEHFPKYLSFSSPSFLSQLTASVGYCNNVVHMSF